MEINNNVFVVTGGGSGLGAATARMIVARGGKVVLADVNKEAGEALAAELDVELAITQSNHEGALIDFLHDHIDSARGALINPAGLTQHGVPLHDAIKGAGVTLIELHISNVHAREAFRHHSYISPVAKAVICGLGVNGYALAIAGLAAFSRRK